MFKIDKIKNMTREEKYKYMLIAAEGQLSSEKDTIANLSNITAIIYALVEDINWSGFYFLKGEELVLGPFRGLPACNRLRLGKGVCGTACIKRDAIIVDDVNCFEGHVACDSRSLSEIVIPIIKDSVVYGVLDIDSPYLNRFKDTEKIYFTKLIDKLNCNIDWSELI